MIEQQENMKHLIVEKNASDWCQSMIEVYKNKEGLYVGCRIQRKDGAVKSCTIMFEGESPSKVEYNKYDTKEQIDNIEQNITINYCTFIFRYINIAIFEDWAYGFDYRQKACKISFEDVSGDNSYVIMNMKNLQSRLQSQKDDITAKQTIMNLLLGNAIGGNLRFLTQKDKEPEVQYDAIEFAIGKFTVQLTEIDGLDNIVKGFNKKSNKLEFFEWSIEITKSLVINVKKFDKKIKSAKIDINGRMLNTVHQDKINKIFVESDVMSLRQEELRKLVVYIVLGLILWFCLIYYAKKEAIANQTEDQVNDNQDTTDKEMNNNIFSPDCLK